MPALIFFIVFNMLTILYSYKHKNKNGLHMQSVFLYWCVLVAFGGEEGGDMGVHVALGEFV